MDRASTEVKCDLILGSNIVPAAFCRHLDGYMLSQLFRGYLRDPGQGKGPPEHLLRLDLIGVKPGPVGIQSLGCPLIIVGKPDG